MLKPVRNAFIAGVVLLLPLAATVFVINFLLAKVGTPMSNFLFFYIDPEIRSMQGVSLLFEFGAIILVVLFITGLGFLSNWVFGRMLVNLSERIITAVPFINAFYTTVKQIVETFSKQKKAVFQQVVLTEYPRKGVYVLGFLTSEAKGEVQARTGEEVVNIFVPTTPNPTSGFLLMVPKDEIIHMDMSVGDGMKLIVSGGAVSPVWPIPADKPELVEVKNPVALDA